MLNGSIGEVLVFNDTASGYSQVAVENYLNAKYFASSSYLGMGLANTSITATSSSTLDLGGAFSGSQLNALTVVTAPP